MKVELYLTYKLSERELNIMKNFFHVQIYNESNEISFSSFKWNRSHDNIELEDERRNYQFIHVLESKNKMNLEDVINIINSYINLMKKYQYVNIIFNKFELVKDDHVKIYLE